MLKPLKGAAHVFDFSPPVIVLPGTQACSAEIEAQHGKPEAVQSFHGVKHHFVVQGAAKQRMRMADHSGVRRRWRARVQQRLKPTRRAVEKKAPNCG